MPKPTRILIFLFFCLTIYSCHVGRFVIYNFADINDYKKFPYKKLLKSEKPFQFITSAPSSKLKMPDSLFCGKKKYALEEGLHKNGTVAFILIRNDSILYEWYDKGYGRTSIVPSFSMVKSVVSMLIGIAIDEGKIKNTSEPITNYLDFLDKNKFGKITIQHLLDMQSGIKYNESYISPFSDVAKYYYGTNLRKYVRHIKIKKEPGRQFEYKSVNTQILGAILEKVTGKSLTEYLQEKLWNPLGMQYDASWSVDSKRHNMEKAFCGLNAKALDFAKFGRLYLKGGNWNGNQIVSKEWVNQSVNRADKTNDFEYSNQWWHTIRWKRVEDTVKSPVPQPNKIFNGRVDKKPQQFVIYPYPDYYMDGHLGQVVYVHPEKKMICVRLGRKYGNVEWPFLFRDIAERN